MELISWQAHATAQLGRGIGDAVGQLGDEPAYLVAEFGHPLTFIREGEARRTAMTERRADPVLETLQRQADGGLLAPQPGRGLGYAAGPGDFIEDLEQVPVEVRSP